MNSFQSDRFSIYNPHHASNIIWVLKTNPNEQVYQSVSLLCKRPPIFKELASEELLLGSVLQFGCHLNASARMKHIYFSLETVKRPQSNHSLTLQRLLGPGVSCLSVVSSTSSSTLHLKQMTLSYEWTCLMYLWPQIPWWTHVFCLIFHVTAHFKWRQSSWNP